MNGETYKYLSRQYAINNRAKKSLSIGDKVFVHPTKSSIARKKYEAIIIKKIINWTWGKREEICTYVDGGHSAVINDYLFNRLEFKEC